jgi:hypothetical protein
VAHQFPPAHSNLSLSDTLIDGRDPPVRVVPDLPPAERHPRGRAARHIPAISRAPAPPPLPQWCADAFTRRRRPFLSRKRPRTKASTEP